MIQFIVGVFVGGFTAVTLFALMIIGSEDDDERSTRK